MKKIYKLFIDENIKTWKKLSTKILLIIILLSLIGTLGLVKFMKSINESNSTAFSNYDWKTDVNNQIKNMTKILKQDEVDDETKRNLQIEVEKYKLAVQYDINPYADFWKSDMLNEIAKLEYEDKNNVNIAKLKEILKNDDYGQYIEIQKILKKQELDNGKITEQEYEDEILVLDLQGKYEIGKYEEYTWKQNIIYAIKTEQKSIRTGLDYNTQKLLTVEQLQEEKDNLKINIYRLEHNIPSLDFYTGDYRMMFEMMAPGFVVAVIAIATIIIAGGEISTEVSNGTIKFWALTPNKRWKILTAKILSVLFYIFVTTLLVSILTILFANVFFSDDGIQYMYVKNGEVNTIGNTLYMLEMYFVKIIPVVLFALLAIMLSTITRNTSVAVSFSVAIYIGNGILMMILNQFIKKDWIRYIPFNNLDIASKIFPNAINPISMNIESFATSTSLSFSVMVLAICAILMLVTTYDSFNHRDII